VRVQPRSKEEVAKVKLFGDWQLRIKFNYTVKKREVPEIRQERRVVPI
jgi:hypothetical protein